MSEGEISLKPEQAYGLGKETAGLNQLPYKEVTKRFGDRLSWHRLRRLLNTGIIKGEKRKREGGGRGFPFIWYTSETAVQKYLGGLKTPREYGRLGGRPAKEKRGIGKGGIIFEGSAS